MSVDTNKSDPFATMETVAWTDIMYDKLQRDVGLPLHFVIVDYGIGGEAKAYAQLMEVNKSLPQVTAELVSARDFTHEYKAQLYASDRSWGLVHIRGTLRWYGHGAWITPTDGNLIAWHGGAGDKGWCPPQDPGMVYSNDYTNPQLSKHNFLKGLEEILEHGSPLDRPEKIFVAEDTTDPHAFRVFTNRVKELVKGYDIKVMLKPYEWLVTQQPNSWTSVFIGLEKDREKHQSVLETIVLKARKEIKSGPKKPLEGPIGVRGDHGCCRGSRR